VERGRVAGPKLNVVTAICGRSDGTEQRLPTFGVRRLPCPASFCTSRTELTSRDEEGIDVPTADHARAQALLSARELWADAIKAGKDLGADAFVIADEDGKQLTFVPIAEVLPNRLR
jgi:hypothetical protein